jgi:DNA-binding beta-propeller fold protein YncE
MRLFLRRALPLAGAPAALLATAAAAPRPLAAQVPSVPGTLVVTNKRPSTATIVDVASGRALATVPTGQGPHEIVLSRDGRTAVVTDYGGRPAGATLTVIDVPAGRVARTIALGEYRAPHGIVFLPGDSLVAVTSEATGHVVVAHVGEGVVRRAVPTQARGSHMVAVAADGVRAFTGNMGSHSVSELDLRAGTFVRSWAVPDVPEAINVTPDGREVWVGSNARHLVSVLDPARGTAATAAEGVDWPYRVLFTPDARTVIVPDMNGDVVRFLDRASRRELGRLAVPGGGPQGIILTPDGRYAFLSLSKQGRVAVLDVGARRIVGSVPAGETPDGVAFAPAAARR